MKRVIYRQEDGGVAVLVPSPEYLQDHTIEELAAKDVPKGGTPYWIIETSDLPIERDFRNAWAISDDMEPTGVTQ